MGIPVQSFIMFNKNKTTRIFKCILIGFLLVTFSACSSGGNSSGDEGTPTGTGDTGDTPALSTSVQALYTNNGANWNDYIKSDSPRRSGDRRISASDTACEASTDTLCLHAGIMRSAAIPDKTDCSGFTATDALGVFEWVCDNSANPVRMFSSSFKTGKGLSDLIDFSNAAWKSNKITISENGTPYAASSEMAWWSNTIVVNNDGSDGSDMNTGEIHIITTNPEANYTIGANRVALVIQPDVTLAGSSIATEDVISGTSIAFSWIEGTINASGNRIAIYLVDTNFSTLHRITTSNAVNSGIDLSASDNNLLSQITSNNNGVAGVSVNNSTGNLLNKIITGNNSGNGVYLNGSSSNVINQIALNNNDCLLLQTGSYDNIISQTTTSCVHIQGGSYNLVTQTISRYGSDYGFRIEPFSFPSYSSQYNTLNNIVASGALTGIDLDDGPSFFTGELRVGNNLNFDCSESSPGLGLQPDCSNEGGSDAVLTTGIDLFTSFVTDSWELLATDDQIRNLLSLPTGDETFTHGWSNENQVVALQNAVEILGDGIGNENALCESNETCFYTPNIGRYQGHGNLIDAGTIGTGGAVENVILKKYETNGY